MAEAPTQITPYFWTTQSRLFQMNSGIFISEGQALLVDPGMYPDELARIKAFVDEQRAAVQTIVITHSHWDHILGPQHFPGVKVITQALYRESVRSEEADLLKVIDSWREKNNLDRSQPFVIPEPNETFEDKTTVEVGSLTLHLTHAPGHAPDLLTVYEPTGAILWASDMLSDLETPVAGFSIVAYRKSLDAVSPLQIRALVPGHGMPTVDRLEIRDRLEEDIAYLKQVQTIVERAVKEGKKLHEVMALCAGMEYRNPTANEVMHQFSVQHAFAELGGTVDRQQADWNPDYAETETEAEAEAERE